jgi:membrane-bound lytic murein transglycosylase
MLKASLMLAGLLAMSAPYAQTAAGTNQPPAAAVATAEKPPHGMTRAQKKAAEDRIEDTAKADKKACKSMSGNAKDVCEAEAKAKEKVAKADLEYQYSPTERNRVKAADMKAEAQYEVAKERCEDQKGTAQSTCKKDAKEHEKAARAENHKSSKG